MNGHYVSQMDFFSNTKSETASIESVLNRAAKLPANPNSSCNRGTNAKPILNQYQADTEPTLKQSEPTPQQLQKMTLTSADQIAYSWKWPS